MAIEDPTTYGEWYWKNSVDANALTNENAEKVFAPIIKQISDDTDLAEFMPDALSPLFGNLTAPPADAYFWLQRPMLQAYTRVIGLISGEEVARPLKYALKASKPTLRIDAGMSAILKQRGIIKDEAYKFNAAIEAYDDEQAELLYKSQMEYPAIPDIITQARYSVYPEDPKNRVQQLIDIPDNLWAAWSFMTIQRLTTEQMQTIYRRTDDVTELVDKELGRLGWRDKDHVVLHDLAYEFPNAMLMIQGGLKAGTDKQTIAENIAKAGIHPTFVPTYYDAVMTKPASEDIIAFELRRDPSLSNLSNELLKIGVHDHYHSLYKELAYQIPPVADIITMAVREAFTPEIAARFGQYQDLPPDFVEWAGKKGLSKEWAERYWAAHWSLPSPQQGFEMLHRGVIGMDDLNMLMRALDIMPFWRDKLVEIAYRPLSRVDVRRMFKLGVLDVSGVRKAYTDIGYNPYNADLMTKFTIEYVKEAPKKLSTTDMVTAYKKHLIDIGTLRNQLSEAGITGADIEKIIKTAEQKREWADTEDNITTIEFLYKQGRYTEDETLTELRKLKLADEYIQNLLPQWTAKSVAEKETLWTNAQTLSFMKANLITLERGKQELTDLGYDEEHINVYLASVKTE
ncbi:unnamed protein product [marine sediment metagenome]|uniref:Uncharacterized protein n=1 Tax=marine sediment metagenome TaxID=412755 RepID=X1QID5_9ZZZZ